MYISDSNGYYVCYGCNRETPSRGRRGIAEFENHILKCTACRRIKKGSKGQKLYYIAKIANDEENNEEYINKAKALIKDGANVDLALLLCSDERKYRDTGGPRSAGPPLSIKYKRTTAGHRVEILEHADALLYHGYHRRELDFANKYKAQIRDNKYTNADLCEILGCGTARRTWGRQRLEECVVKMWLDWYKFELSREGEYQRSILASLRTMPPTYREITPEHAWILKVERMVKHEEASVDWLVRVLETASRTHEAPREDICSICHDNFNDVEIVYLPGCNHGLHPQCLKSLVDAKEKHSDKCPVCRKPFEYK